MNTPTRTLSTDGNRAAQTHIDSAKFCARAGEYEAALEMLEGAIEAGYKATSWWSADLDLQHLAHDPRFHELIERGVDARASV